MDLLLDYIQQRSRQKFFDANQQQGAALNVDAFSIRWNDSKQLGKRDILVWVGRNLHQALNTLWPTSQV
jgi:hypothetical protein